MNSSAPKESTSALTLTGPAVKTLQALVNQRDPAGVKPPVLKTLQSAAVTTFLTLYDEYNRRGGVQSIQACLPDKILQLAKIRAKLKLTDDIEEEALRDMFARITRARDVEEAEDRLRATLWPATMPIDEAFTDYALRFLQTYEQCGSHVPLGTETCKIFLREIPVDRLRRQIKRLADKGDLHDHIAVGSERAEEAANTIANAKEYQSELKPEKAKPERPGPPKARPPQRSEAGESSQKPQQAQQDQKGMRCYACDGTGHTSRSCKAPDSKLKAGWSRDDGKVTYKRPVMAIGSQEAAVLASKATISASETTEGSVYRVGIDSMAAATFIPRALIVEMGLEDRVVPNKTPNKTFVMANNTEEVCRDAIELWITVEPTQGFIHRRIAFQTVALVVDWVEEILIGFPDIKRVGIFDPCAPQLHAQGVLEPVQDFNIPTVDEDEEPDDGIVSRSCEAIMEEFQDLGGPLPPKGSKLQPFPVDLIDEGKIHRYAPRFLSPTLREVVSKEIKEMLKAGVIRKSHSAYASPLVLVRKKDGSFRMCVDYRALNANTKRMSMPLQRVEAILQNLAGKKHFASLDLKSGYWQIPMREGDEAKTAFATHDGLYEFLKMPFGPTNGPSFFQAALQDALADLLYTRCQVFQDDILVHGTTQAEFLENLRAVLERLRSLDLRLNTKKCRVGVSSVEYLGHVVSADGVSLSQDRFEAIDNIQVPKTRKELRSFLGMAIYYRPFVANLATIMGPLSRLTSTKVPFAWTDEQSKAFKATKDALRDAGVLKYIDYEHPILLRTDASDQGLGAVLMNVIDGKEQPIAYASRTFNTTERGWTVGEREAFAIVYAVKKWEGFLKGVHFIVETDHKNLLAIQKKESQSAKIERWAMLLASYDFEVRHVAGKDNEVADTLSRLVASARPRRQNVGNPMLRHEDMVLIDDNDDIVEAADLSAPDEPIAAAPETPLPEEASPADTEEIDRERAQLTERARAVQTRANIGSLTDDDKAWIQTQAHGPSRGHCGIKETIRRIQHLGYGWRGLKKDVRDYVLSCPVCQKTNGAPKMHVRMGTTMAENPFDAISIDTVKITPESDAGFKYVFVIVDQFTRWTEIVPSQDKSARSAAQALLSAWVARYGPPRRLLSDQGTEFCNEIFTALARPLDIEHHTTFAYHPEGNGMCERRNQEVIRRLRQYAADWQAYDRWEFCLPYVQFMINTCYHAALGTSPFELVFGKFPRYHGNMLPNSGDEVFIQTESPDEYIQELNAWLDHAKAKARQVQRTVLREREDDGPSRPDVQVGQLVLLSPPHRAAKLAPNYLGPFRVTQVLDFGLEVQKLDDQSLRRVHIDRVLPFTDPGLSEEQLVELAASDDQERLVEQIRAHEPHSGCWWFLVKWYGVAVEHSSWLAAEDVNRLALYSDYLEEHPECRVPPSGEGAAVGVDL